MSGLYPLNGRFEGNAKSSKKSGSVAPTMYFIVNQEASIIFLNMLASLSDLDACCYDVLPFSSLSSPVKSLVMFLNKSTNMFMH